jgi:hypothetical protein
MFKVLITILFLIEMNFSHDSSGFEEINRQDFTETQVDNSFIVDSVNYSLKLIKVKDSQIFHVLDTIIGRSEGLFDSIAFDKHMFSLSLVEYDDSTFLYARNTNFFDIDSSFCLGVLIYNNEKIIINSSSKIWMDFFEVEEKNTKFFSYKYYQGIYEFMYPPIYFDRKYLITDSSFLFLHEKKIVMKLIIAPNDTGLYH